MNEKEMFLKPTSLLLSSKDAKEAIFLLRDCYQFKKIENRLYTEDHLIPENIIALYVYFVKQSDYQLIINNYKLQYIDNEAEVESHVTLEERIGLAYIYDYISSYDFKSKTPNIFIDAIKMHCLLYQACPYPEFGGKLRQDNVRLQDSVYEVMPADEARSLFQSYLNKQIKIDYDNILGYIDEAIKTMVDLIKIQPFIDGNKRTFRALLNLLLGKIGISPVYIKVEERNIYKKELLKAIETGDYTGIIKFYYYKICDSIIELDLMNESKSISKTGTSFVKK